MSPQNSGRKGKSREHVIFDETKRREYLLGFRKRKQQRRRAAELKKKQKHLELQRERRSKRKKEEREATQSATSQMHQVDNFFSIVEKRQRSIANEKKVLSKDASTATPYTPTKSKKLKNKTKLKEPGSTGLNADTLNFKAKAKSVMQFPPNLEDAEKGHIWAMKSIVTTSTFLPTQG